MSEWCYVLVNSLIPFHFGLIGQCNSVCWHFITQILICLKSF